MTKVLNLRVEVNSNVLEVYMYPNKKKDKVTPRARHDNSRLIKTGLI